MGEFKPSREQRAILDHDAGQHARVLAGPGTGKSATLVALIDQLLDSHEPVRVKLLTFTRAATGELAKKVSAHPKAAAERPSTIHSFAISVLLRNQGVGEFPQPLRIADDWEKDQLVYPTLARRIGVQKRRLENLFRELASNWESLQPEKHPRVNQQDRARFLGGWQEHREVLGYTLLSELPNALRKALLEHPDLDGVDYDLLIVDEYQDLNACDLEVLQLIGGRGCSIIAAGDDDQSIYSFRRAAPEGIRRFPADYPDCGDYSLSITRRCGSKIIEWASFVIEGDPGRPQKPRLSPAPGSPPGIVALLAFKGEKSEARGVAKLVQKLVVEECIDPADILVLLRSDHNGVFSKPIKEALAKLDIPCSDPDVVKRVLAEPDNRRLLATLRLLSDPTDSLAWATLLHLEAGIGAIFFDTIYRQAQTARNQFGQALLEAYEQSFSECPAISRQRARKLVADTLAWLDAHQPPEESEDGWGNWILSIAGSGGVPTPSDELVEILHGVDDLVEPGHGLGRYLSQITPLGKDRAQTESKGVRIMSMAASKGLTVEAAILPALEQGLVPRPDQDIAEERRLLYVAMTRAKRFLFGTWARRRTGPTARAGSPRVVDRRSSSSFLAGGPISSKDGDTFLRGRLT